MKKTVGMILVLLLTLVGVSALADVEIKETNFPDANFRQYITERGYDTDGDGTLSDEEISHVTSIVCGYSSITDLTGIEHFTALTVLHCGHNQLTALDLSKNTALTELDCSSNKLTALDLSQNTLLREIRMNWSRELETLILGPKNALEELYFDNAQLTTLDLSQCPALKSVSCSSSQLTSLNISNCSEITYLYISNNRLTSLDLSDLTKLEKLYCDSNQLTSLDVSNNKALKDLSCYENRFTTLNVSECPVLCERMSKYNRDNYDDYYDYWGSGDEFEDDFEVLSVDPNVTVTTNYGVFGPISSTATGKVSLTIDPLENLLIGQSITFTIEAEGATDVQLCDGKDPYINYRPLDDSFKIGDGKWARNYVLFSESSEWWARASFDGGNTWVETEKQTIIMTSLGTASYVTSVEAEEVHKGVPLVIRITDAVGVDEHLPSLYKTGDDGNPVGVNLQPSEVTVNTIVYQTADLEEGQYIVQIDTMPLLGYHETCKYVNFTVLPAAPESATPESTTTPAPVTDTPTEPDATTEPDASTTPDAPAEPTMPSTVSDSTGSYNIGSDGTATFSKPAGSAATVSIPATITVNGQNVRVTAIADKAFQKDKKLTTVTIGKNIKTIGKNAFANCAKLKTVKGGAAVTTIKDGAFSGCKVLKTFPAMGKLQKIGANAFKGDKVLAKFTLAKTVTSIGKNAFNGCAGLKTITVKTEKLTNKNVGAGAFKGINKKATFKCPKKQLKNYKTLFVKKGAPKTCKFK